MVFLRATTEAGVEIDVVLAITLRTVLGDSNATSSRTLNGTDDAAFLILGSSEDDMLTGSNKSDDIRGGEGNDILDGRPGPDLFYGGAGIDTVSYARSDAGVTVRLADDGASAPVTGGHAEGDILYGIENLTGSDFDDVLIDNDGQNRFTGGDGSDIFGIDLVASHITEADVIMDFSGRNADGSIKDDHDKIQFLAFSGHRFLYFLAADLTSDNSDTKNDWIFYNHEDGGSDGVLFIIRGDDPRNINFFLDDIDIIQNNDTTNIPTLEMF